MTTVIDFENFSDLQEINTVSVPGNEVTFTTGTTTGTNPAYIAGVGDPVTGFGPDDGAGTPIESQIGDFFLTTQNVTDRNRKNYFIEFDQPVENLSIDALDFLIAGERITLTVFSESFSTAVGSDTFTIPSSAPNPNLETLSVANPSASIRSASLILTGDDIDTGIDNITFDTVPQVAEQPREFSEAGVDLKLLDANRNEITDNTILGDTFFLEVLVEDPRETDATGLMAFTYNLDFAPDVLENTNDFSTPADNNNLIPANFPLLGDGTLDNTNGEILDLGAGSLPNADGEANGTVIGVDALETFSTLTFNVEDSATRDDSRITLTVDPSQTGFADGKYADPNVQLEFTQDLIINDAPVVDAIADVSIPEDVTVASEIISASAITATEDDLGNPLTFTLTSPDDGNGNALFSFFDATQTGDERFVETSPADANNPSQSALPVVVTPTGDSVIDFESGVTSYEVSVVADDGFKSSPVPEVLNVGITDVNDPTIAVSVTSITFGTNLPEGTTSELVRPALPDVKAITITNTGNGPADILNISSVTVNPSRVSINSVWEEGDVLLNPGESRDLFLTYAPETAGEEFDLTDGLVINSNAVNDPDVEVSLLGKSTYNSDINYDGTVDLNDLAVLEGVTFPSRVGEAGYEATADINGDGNINRGELIPLNFELFETINPFAIPTFPVL
ncbi:UNVERIFIED_CONTAM: hypothetical protein BEN50_01980 [Euhalothece sp. KZN 001]